MKRQTLTLEQIQNRLRTWSMDPRVVEEYGRGIQEVLTGQVGRHRAQGFMRRVRKLVMTLGLDEQELLRLATECCLCLDGDRKRVEPNWIVCAEHRRQAAGLV